MKIKSLKIIKGLFHKEFDFDAKNVLVFSSQNSVGKTTLLRVLLYSMGFMIPSTKRFKIPEYSFELTITTDSGKELCLNRTNCYFSIKDTDTNQEQNFSLPADIISAHSCIFENNNVNILQNILGVMYVDQEKGWTLLNRGTVIGSIHFNIYSYIQGIANIDCKDLYDELKYIEEQLDKYKNILNISDYQNQIEGFTQQPSYDSSEDVIDKEIAILEFEKKPLIDEKNRLKNVLNKNTSFKKYITSMKLYVKDISGNRIPVNEDTIDGFRDNIELIVAKINIIQNKIVAIDNKILRYNKSRTNENALFKAESLVERLDSDISKIRIDNIAVKGLITQLEAKKTKIKDEIDKKTKSNNSVIKDLHEVIVKYAKELNISDDYVKPSVDYIFTSDLKSLSGAIFHKIVFCFQLAYIEILKKYLNINIPIILDSPRGKEVDEKNIAEMLNILKRDFSDHQVIISSIYKYDFPQMKTFEIKNSLLEDSFL